MLREQELQRVWRRFSNLVPVRPGTEGGSRAQNLPAPPALKTSGQQGSTAPLNPSGSNCLQGQSTFSFSPTHFLLLLFRQTVVFSFQFSLPGQVTCFILNVFGLLTTENALKIHFTSPTTNRGISSHTYITYMVVYGAP